MGQVRTWLLAVSILVCAIPVLAILLPRIYDTKYSGTYGADCRYNLTQLSAITRFYVDDNDPEKYPELSEKPGVLAMKAESICPKYLTDLKLLQCPAQRKLKKWYQLDPTPPTACDDDQSYFYLGYRISDQATLEQFARAYRATLVAQKSFEDNLQLTLDNGERVNIPRLNSRNALTLVGETITSDVPIFIERVPNNHAVKGGNVVYANGRYEWIKWGEKWPMTPEAMEVLLALDALGKE